MPLSATWRRSGVLTLIVAPLLVAGACPADPAMNELPDADILVSEDVSVGLPVRADGSGSTDADGDDIYLTWTLQTPPGSSAQLDDDQSTTPSFTPDVEGDYVLTLTVNDFEGSTDTSVTITASDNSSTTTVDGAGGQAVSSDGRLRIDVPAGALASPIDIVITIAAPSQFPDAFTILGIPEMEVFDVQPAGLTFSVPATASIDFADAVGVSGGFVTLATGTMLAAGPALPAPLRELTFESDPVTPTTGVLSAEIADIGVVGVVGGLEVQHRRLIVRANPPTQVPVGDDFDIQVTALVDPNIPPPPYAPDITIAGGVAVDASLAPVAPDPSGVTYNPVPLTPVGDGSWVATLDYVCESAGQGEWVSTVTLDEIADIGTDFYTDTVGFRLRWGIECVAPPPSSERSVSRATWVSPGATPNEILVGGHDPERWDVVSGAVTPLGGPFGTEQVHYLYPVGAGLYANTVIGKSFSWTSTDDWTLLSQLVPDYALQFTLGEDGVLYGAGGPAHPRTVGTDFSLNSYAYDYIQAYWSDGTDGIMIQTSGDGNSTFNPSYAVRANAVAGQPITPLSGDAMDVTLDVEQRLARDFSCARLPTDPTRLVCVFTGGETSPGSLVSGQTDRDGYYEIFQVDLAANSTTSLEWARIAAVGANARAVGSAVLVSFTDQEGESIEMREVGASGITQTNSVPFGSTCTRAFDYTLTPSRQHGVVSCWGQDGAGGADDKYIYITLPWW